MTLEEILAGESQNLEFKVDIPAKSEKYMKTVVAFANGNGGRIVFGVEDQTLKIVGFEEKTAMQKIDDITNAIWDSCEPKIRAEVYSQVVDGKNIIVAEIPKGMMPPYSVKGQGIWNGTYVRISGTTRVAPDYMVKELTLEGMNQTFDRRRVDRVLTAEEISALCDRLYAHALELIPKEEKAALRPVSRAQLISWGLIVEEHGKDYATNGFQLLDGKMDAYEDAYIQCAVFKGTNRSVFITHKDVTGPIDEQIEAAYAFVLEHIRLGSRIEGIGRQDFYELPTNSIREMISNAVCHRSYLAPSKIQVALYDDRLEVTTPGMLNWNITIEKMKNGQSLLRNKGIAAAFSYLHIIEGWGSGIPRILQEAEEYHLKEPELIDLGDSFRINLFRRDFETDSNGIVDPKKNTTQTANRTANQTNQTANRTPRGTNQTNQTNRTGQGNEENRKSSQYQLKDRDRAILHWIKNNPSGTQKKFSEQMQVPLSQVKYDFMKLRENNFIRYVGSVHNGHWEILIEDSVWQN